LVLGSWLTVLRSGSGVRSPESIDPRPALLVPLTAGFGTRFGTRLEKRGKEKMLGIFMAGRSE
jgi:hypothetical protein